MGLFSRKSFKITPSVRLHIGKKSISTTFKLTGMRIRTVKNSPRKDYIQGQKPKKRIY